MRSDTAITLAACIFGAVAIGILYIGTVGHG
jgi:hypothetical protein